MANLGDNRPHFFFLAPHQLDDLEPRADSRGPYGGSIAHHCALFATRRGSGVITQVTVRLYGIPAAIFGSSVLVRQYSRGFYRYPSPAYVGSGFLSGGKVSSTSVPLTDRAQ